MGEELPFIETPVPQMPGQPPAQIEVAYNSEVEQIQVGQPAPEAVPEPVQEVAPMDPIDQLKEQVDGQIAEHEATESQAWETSNTVPLPAFDYDKLTPEEKADTIKAETLAYALKEPILSNGTQSIDDRLGDRDHSIEFTKSDYYQKRELEPKEVKLQTKQRELARELARDDAEPEYLERDVAEAEHKLTEARERVRAKPELVRKYENIVIDADIKYNLAPLEALYDVNPTLFA
jgi:hypothetical protein